MNVFFFFKLSGARGRTDRKRNSRKKVYLYYRNTNNKKKSRPRVDEWKRNRHHNTKERERKELIFVSKTTTISLGRSLARIDWRLIACLLCALYRPPRYIEREKTRESLFRRAALYTPTVSEGLRQHSGAGGGGVEHEIHARREENRFHRICILYTVYIKKKKKRHCRYRVGVCHVIKSLQLIPHFVVCTQEKTILWPGVRVFM